MKSFQEQSRKQIVQLAKKLIDIGVDPKTGFEGAPLHLPKEVASYQGEVIGTLEEFVNG